MANKDYYEILGVDRKATRDEIKKAYKNLAKRYHPDVNKEEGSADKFKEISEAAAVLGDDKKRQQYDQFGSADTSGFDFNGFDFSNFGGGRGFGGFDFDSIFESLFGGGNIFSGQRRRGPTRGHDLLYSIEITLHEAAKGADKSIVIPKTETCTKCRGSGAKSDSDIHTCETCHGNGMVKQTRRTPFGIFSTTSHCPKCGGEGKTIKEYCVVCDGDGTVKKTKKIDVKIPPGVDTGNRLRIQGEGEAGEKGGPSGNLYVEIHVQPHDFLDRKGPDLYTEIPITFVIAALGGSVDVETLDSKVKLKVPAGTQSHTLFRLKGKGLPHLRGSGTGDLFVRAVIQTPSKLTKDQKASLEKFAKAGGDKLQQKRFFDKLKEAFQ